MTLIQYFLFAYLFLLLKSILAEGGEAAASCLASKKIFKRFQSIFQKSGLVLLKIQRISWHIEVNCF